MLYHMQAWKHRDLTTYFGIMASALTARAPVHAKNAGNDNLSPVFHLNTTEIDGHPVGVTEDILDNRDFGALLHFKRNTARNDPKVLIVVPTSGHYPTLLRETVAALLPHHDVYITNWKNARDVPLSAGEFGLEDYIAYTQDFIRALGPDVHVIGCSQSTVPVLAAVALMSARQNDIKPLSMTLMAGPIDSRAAHSKLSKFAFDQNPDWFRNHAVATVPANFNGAGRSVYPGFLSFDPAHKIRAHLHLFNALARNDHAEARRIQHFEQEYDSVSDVHGKLYLDIIDQYFQRHTLARGEMTWRSEQVDPSRIARTALLTIEGEQDDITRPGQTLPAHGLCHALKADQHYTYIQPGIDHYGVMSGLPCTTEIIPRVTAFIRNAAAGQNITHDPVKTPGALISPRLIDPAPLTRYLNTVNLSKENHRNGSGPRIAA